MGFIELYEHIKLCDFPFMTAISVQNQWNYFRKDVILTLTFLMREDVILWNVTK